jgi:Fic family protein
MFNPHYSMTPGIVKALMTIETNRQAVRDLPIDVQVLASLRRTARLASTHYSTQIEGNRLTPAQVKEAVGGAKIPGKERDEVEVRHYYQALKAVESMADRCWPLTEKMIQTITGLVMKGQEHPLPFREGQNVIRDSVSGGIVYLPPEAKDVSGLVNELLDWINEQHSKGELPVPVIAGLAHYQYATIHPYYDGNGRTARLLATLILRGSGYGLKGIYSLDEYYARNLTGYYAALTVGDSHNYYMGRAEADVTGFLQYFCEGMAEAFGAVRKQAEAALARGARDLSEELIDLDPRERRLLELFAIQGALSSTEMAAHLGLSQRTVMGMCPAWVAKGFLVVADSSRKRRLYRLAPQYKALIRVSKRLGDEGLEPPTSAV